jgi:sulfide:quinone oxidoreductase
MTSTHADRPLHVVIAGGGVGGLEALIALRELAGERVQLTLVAPDDDFVYRPLSVGEPFALGPPEHVPLNRVARDFDATLSAEALAGVDADARTATLASGDVVAYDKLVVALGGRREPVYPHAATFRGQEDSEALHGLVQDVEEGYSRRIVFVVPTGVAWSLPIYELALMLADRARSMGMDSELTIVTPEESPLAVFGRRASDDVAALLEAAGISVRASTTAEIPAQGKVVLHPGAEAIECDRVVALPVVRGIPIAGLPNDSDGFLPIDSNVRVIGITDVYAAGDGTTFPLKQGGIATQMADTAAADIAREAGVLVDPEPFRPVLRGRLMTGDKPHFMRREVANPSHQGESGEHMLWWPPAKIAGKRLAPYLAHLARERRHGADLEDAVRHADDVQLHGYEFASRWPEAGHPAGQ